MKWTVRTRLIGLSVLGILLLLGVGLTGSLALRNVTTANDVMSTYSKAGRYHVEVDMMHDAIHNDGLIFATGTKSEIEGARRNLDEHVESVLKFEEATAKLAVSPDIQKLTEELKPMFDKYIAMAKDLGDKAVRGDHAAVLAALPAFTEQFESMEQPQEDGSELIEKAGQVASANVASASRNGQLIMLIMSIVAVIILLFAANRVTASIVTPLSETVRVMDAVADGNLDARTNLRTDDELGQLGKSVNRAVDSLSRTLSGIARNATAVGQASEQLTNVSAELSNNAHETSTRSQQVSAAAEQVDASVRLVASSSQQVSASIREVTQNTNEAVSVASSAVRVAGEANTTIRQLGESSEQIDNVVRVISSIAEQTNILALNAEIEAARAGEAGKGFSVVANEVKDLAKETARATEDIARKVSAIRSDSRAAVQAISEITQIIDRISGTQTNIASSMQEQNSGVGEITRSMGEASRGTAEIANNITAVASMAERGAYGAQETQRAASELSARAAELQQLVSAFRFTAAPEPGGGFVSPHTAIDSGFRRAA